MKAVAVALKGTEKIASEEIKELVKAKTKKITDGRLLLETKTLKKLEKARTIRKLYSYIKHFKFKEEKEIYKKAEKLDYPVKKTFVVRCERTGNHKFRSGNIEAKIGEIIFKRGNKVKLKNPETTIHLEIVENTCIIGILHKKDMQKRDYRVRLSQASLNACLAASMARFSEIKKNHTIVDPFCKDGTIAIETGLQGVKKIYCLDESLNNIRNTKINSKLAGIKLETTKAEVDWLDTQFKKATVDRIITMPPCPSKNKKLSDIQKTTKELIHQAKFILKKDGILVTASQNPKIIEKEAKENGLKIIKKMTVTIGNSIYKVEAFKP